MLCAHGSLDELEQSQANSDYESRRAAIDGYVDEVVANGLYEIVTTRSAEG